MICNNCNLDRDEKDFINNQEFCYHCMYRIKLKNMIVIRKPKKMFCRTCGKEVIRIENLKKRQRNVYCSEICALQGHRLLNANYWTRSVKPAKAA